MPWCNLEGGRRLWYEDQGAGSVLVLLHGWCMSSAIWRFQFETLVRSFRVIAPDLRGHGQSEASSEGHNFTGFSRDVRELFRQLDLRHALLAGWSLGAQIALLACAPLRERLAGLALISGTPRFTACADFPYGLDETGIAGMSLKVRRNPAKALEDFKADMFTDGERDYHDPNERIRRLLTTIPVPDKRVALDGLDALAGADMRDLLPAIDLPTLIINGDRDRICLPGASGYMADRIPASTHVTLNGCGHAPFLTHCAECNDLITGFCGRIF